MAGLLDGLAKAVFSGFKGKLLTGTLRRDTPSATLDENGDPDSYDPTTWAVQGFTDGYSDSFRMKAGIPIEDVKVCIFGASLPAGIRPKKDDRVSLTFKGVTTWYQLRGRVDTDPAQALWECQAYVCPEPE